MTDKKLYKLMDKVYFTINQTLDKACPKKLAGFRDFNNPWYTDRLEKIRSQVKKSCEAMKRVSNVATRKAHKANKNIQERNQKE